MVHAIRIHAAGGPEVLQWETVDVGDPGPGEVRLRQTAVGLNYIDVYHRTGLYPVPGYPCTPGMEAAGVVEAVGGGVTTLTVGDRVAYASPPMGSYAQVRLMPAERLVRLPDDISDHQAAAMMLQGMTTEYLLRRTFPVKAGDIILLHAAAGGVGLLMCQWAKYLGATVIGTVGTDAKADLARANGCDHAIVYDRENFVEEVRRITEGSGVDVVYDSVGQDTFERSLDCIRPLGMIVTFGNASGPVPPFNLGLLAAKGSLFVTRPTLMSYTAKTEDLRASAAELFRMVQGGHLHVAVNQTYPLQDAATAHRDLEARRTTGATILLP